jgi:hypothetical protein
MRRGWSATTDSMIPVGEVPHERPIKPLLGASVNSPWARLRAFPV